MAFFSQRQNSVSWGDSPLCDVWEAKLPTVLLCHLLFYQEPTMLVFSKFLLRSVSQFLGGSADLVSCWFFFFLRVLVSMWQRVNWVQLLLFFTACKPKSTSWHVAKSRESHTFLELCSTNKLASLGCREPGTRWAPRCFLLIFMSSSSIHQSVSCRGKTRWTDGRQSGGFSL